MTQSRRRQEGKVTTITTASVAVNRSDHDIAVRAYELYEQRGGEHGHDVDDWLQAEREVRPAMQSTAA